jgi:hypothetical protein
MVARLSDLVQNLTDGAQPEVATPQPEAAAEAQLSSEGAIPEVADGAAVEPGASASEQAFGNKPTAPTGQIDAGMYTHEEYKTACQAAGTPEKWDDNYWHGHTAAKQWVQPYEGRYDNVFELKRGESASQAVKDFLAGPTISDYRVIGVAIEMDELRDTLGDHTFDRFFGSKEEGQDAQISPAQRLKITSAMYTIPFVDQMMAIANDAMDAENRSEEPEAPAVAAGMEQQPQVATTSAPAPEMVADELGLLRDQELA